MIDPQLKKAKTYLEKGDLKDIAKKKGVSKSLVYKVISGKRKNIEIKKEILETAFIRAQEIEKLININN